MPVLVAGLGFMLAGRVPAQTFTTLYAFPTAGSSNTNSVGANLLAALTLSGNKLYGTAYYGGTNGSGTVFAVTTDGTGITNLHNFAASPGDGANPQACMILSGNTLYGTATKGGSLGGGTVFAIGTNGTGYTNLHSLTALSGLSNTNSDGATPYAGLLLSGNTLYGTAYSGGTNGNGTVFALNTNGTGFTTLYSFTATNAPYFTNSDGAHPYAGLTLSGNTLYGTASFGGSSGNGTIFALGTNGTGFTNLHNFTVMNSPYFHQQRRSLSACRTDFIGQHAVWDSRVWRHILEGELSRHKRQWHGVRCQHRWHGFYEPA